MAAMISIPSHHTTIRGWLSPAPEGHPQVSALPGHQFLSIHNSSSETPQPLPKSPEAEKNLEMPSLPDRGGFHFILANPSLAAHPLSKEKGLEDMTSILHPMRPWERWQSTATVPVPRARFEVQKGHSSRGCSILPAPSSSSPGFSLVYVEPQRDTFRRNMAAPAGTMRGAEPNPLPWLWGSGLGIIVPSQTSRGGKGP